MVEVRIMKFSPYGSVILLFFAGKVSSRNSKGDLYTLLTMEGWIKSALFYIEA